MVTEIPDVVSIGRETHLTRTRGLEKYSLIKVYTTLWICTTLIERLPNLAFWAHYDDGHRGVSEAVL